MEAVQKCIETSNILKSMTTNNLHDHWVTKHSGSFYTVMVVMRSIIVVSYWLMILKNLLKNVSRDITCVKNCNTNCNNYCRFMIHHGWITRSSRDDHKMIFVVPYRQKDYLVGKVRSFQSKICQDTEWNPTNLLNQNAIQWPPIFDFRIWWPPNYVLIYQLGVEPRSWHITRQTATTFDSSLNYDWI